MTPRAPDSCSHERRDGAPPLAVVVTAESDADVLAHVRALTDWTVVALEDYWQRSELHNHEIHVVIINAIDCLDHELHLRIARAASRFPDAPLAVYVRIEEELEQTLLEVRLGNVAGVIRASDEDQPERTLRQILGARAAWRARQLVEALPNETPAWLGDLLHGAVAFGYVPLQCNLLARMAGAGLRSLDRKLQALGLPGVENWLTRGRMICALDAVACGLRLVQDAGHDVGYADPASVRRAATAHFGCSMTGAAKAGGVRYIIDLWRAGVDDALARKRERERERERERRASK